MQTVGNLRARRFPTGDVVRVIEAERAASVASDVISFTARSNRLPVIPVGTAGIA